MLLPASRPTRRAFLKTSAVAAAAFSLPRFSIAQSGPSANAKLNVACIGIGNRGWFAVSELLKNPHVNLVAFCDVDRNMVDALYKHAAELRQQTPADVPMQSVTDVPVFRDYREMFAQIADKFDAVTVSTPDHHHFPAAMMAIAHGKHVYVEKPLAHSVDEVRALRAAARQHGIVSQMGNQGRATEGIRLIKEWTDAGVVGDVREIVAWSPAFSDRYFRRPDSLPVAAETPPDTLDWDLWLGPAEARPYNNALYQPERWRGWWPFGNGMLGDWACHTLDGPHWALDLSAPSAVEVAVSEVSDENSPHWAEVSFHFPARGNLPPATLKWCEGHERIPPTPAAWDPDPKTPFPNRGFMMLGSRNTLYASGGRPDSPRLMGKAVWEDFKQHRPAPTIPRVVGGPVKEWIEAIRGTGPMCGSNFDYSARLAELVLLGVVAERSGKSFNWDAAAGRSDNAKVNELLAIHAREGWRIPGAAPAVETKAAAAALPTTKTT